MKKRFSNIFSKFFRKKDAQVKSNKQELIEYLIDEYSANQLALGKHNQRIYISFDDKDISNFLNDWFTFLKLKKEHKITEASYKMFTNSIKDKVN